MTVDWYVHGFEADRYAQELSAAIEATGNIIHLLQLPPFSAELPKAPTTPFVLYGGTRIIEAATADSNWRKGVWFDPFLSRWHLTSWEWGDLMLMQNRHIVPIGDIGYLTCQYTDSVFVRPNDDLKEFAGEVMSFKDLLTWRNSIISIKDEPGVTITPDTYIIVGDVIEIAREWRIFIVDSKPVSCSRYRSYGRFDSVAEFPEEVEEFITKVCDRWLPAPVVVIDIGVNSDGQFGVIEANCFNSSGWYDNDMQAVVAAVSEYVEKQ